jgi:hypothetical protein
MPEETVEKVLERIVAPPGGRAPVGRLDDLFATDIYHCRFEDFRKFDESRWLWLSCERGTASLFPEGGSVEGRDRGLKE